ncbi:GGDEF domain-containing protein [Paramagnetospirillum kuznetsovii]|uniref:GGDEF domain-containing protein n=2 Tax=Paramagnetospirillum kuznetsovii TaxID=2053833 RepID=A0A364NX36_9PROT|nr:GGDEF domain-containing protein [Paramagnetospirillum kuznetsovii]
MLPILFERLGEVFFRTGADGVVEWVSPNVSQLLGYSPQEMTGMPASQMYVRPTDRDALVAAVLAGKGAAVNQEVAQRRKDGSTIWTLMSICGDFAADGTFLGIQGVVRDITDHWQTRKTLEDSEDRFRRLSDVAMEAICIHYQGKIIDFNNAFENLFRYTREEFLQMWAWDVIDPRDIPRAKEMVRVQYEDPYEVRGLRKDGSVFPMEIYSKHSWMGEKSVRVTSIRDLTQRKQAEATVRLLSQAVEQSPVAVLVVNGGGAVQYANSAHSAVSSIPVGSVIGQPLLGLFPPKARPAVDEMWRTLCQGGEWRGEIQAQSSGGSPCWLQVRSSTVSTPGDDDTHYLVVMEDVTVRKEQERRLQHQALFDGLTDLPNRVQALERLSHEIESARDAERKVALLFVDLDEFKSINDSLGHEYGDELLIMASERLRRAAGPGNMVARFGGDEFLVIMGDIAGAPTAEAVAAAVVEEFAVPFTISRRDLIATASIGLALYPEDGRTPQTLLRNADTAMYQAKLGGRNRSCFFTARMNEEAETRLKIEGELRRAVGTDQLFLNYQPLVEVRTGRVLGMEALLRWKNPELGNMPPDRFISQAETSGLIVPIGRMVLQSACRAARGWVDAGHAHIRVCVNVSPRQFQDAAFLEDVRAALSASGLPATNLELEITEGLLLAERAEVDSVLNTLESMGVQLSIDDFGTGYSSLSYLERYPFDTLKIDRSFMIGMLERHERKVLVETIVAMANGLGLKVIAEGVETSEQLAHLDAINCDIAQGYLFSRPVPEAEAVHLLARNFLL